MKRFLSVLTILLLIGFNASAQLRIYTPTMTAPVDGAVDQMPDALLDWQAVTGQGTEILYEVQLATSEDFSDAVTFPQTMVTALNTSELLFSQTYFWRVRADDGIATSEWSSPWSFTVVNTVTITKPTNASIENPDPLLEWKEITGITKYEIQVDTAYSWRLEGSGQSKNLNDIYIVDETTAYAVGASGTLLKKDGESWSAEQSTVSVDLFSVHFTSPDNGWVSGAAGTLLQFDGTGWNAVASGTTKDLNGLFFLSANEGYAVGNGGVVLKYDGSAWNSINVGLTSDLFAIHGLDANNIVIVGASGKSAIFDGSNWTTYTSGNRDKLGVWMLAPDKIWASAKAGRIYSFDGDSWTEQTVGNRDLRAISFLDNETGYMTGRNGTILAYDGESWHAISSGTSSDLSGIHIFSEEKGYLVGNNGIVISYQGDGFNSPYLKNFTVSSNLLQYRLSRLAFGKAHYFRMRAVHAQSTSEWSGANAFTTIARPTLKSPAYNTSNMPLDLFLKWEKLTGIVKYTIQLADNADFQNPSLFESGIEEYEINNLTFGITYHWRVSARHADDVSDWSEPFKFSTVNCVTLSAPANEATNITRLPRYTWVVIEGAEKYMIEIDKSPDFSNAELNISETNFYQQLYLLNAKETYFWRVRAIQGLDTTTWCSAWKFTTQDETSVEEHSGNEFKIYPNPANDKFQVLFDAGNNRNATLEVYNMIGSKVYQKSFVISPGQNNEIVNISEIKAGMYFIKLQLNDQAYTKRLIIE